MPACSLTSKRYPGLTVRYAYEYEAAQVSYTWTGEFNGGTPTSSELEIEDVQIGSLSVYEYLNEQVLEGLRDEIIDRFAS